MPACEQHTGQMQRPGQVAAPCYKPAVAWDPQVAAYLAGALGHEAFHQMSSALSKPPTCTCVRVNTCKASVQDVLSQLTQAAQQQLEQQHPAAPQQEQQQSAVQGEPYELPYVHPHVPFAVMLPGKGPLSVDYSLAGGHEVIISRKAGEAVLRGAPVYAPGVVACTGGVTPGQLVAVTVAIETPGSKSCGITRGTILPLNHIQQHTAAATQAAAAATQAAGVTVHAGIEAVAPGTSFPSSQPATEVGCNAINHASDPLADADKAAAVPTVPNAAEAAGKAGTTGIEIKAATVGNDIKTATVDNDVKTAVGDDIKAATVDNGTEAATVDSGTEAATVDNGTKAATVDNSSKAGALHDTNKRALSSMATGLSKRAATARAQRAAQQLPSRQHLHVGLGRAMMSRAEMFRVDGGLAIDMVQPVFTLPSVSGIPEGWTMLQNLPSIVAALALSPAPGSRVLDMCAAPGGKTTMLAQIMRDQGEIIALDRTHVKAQEIMSLAAELGFTCIKAYRMDATKALLQPTAYEQEGLGAKTHPETEGVTLMDTAEGGDSGGLHLASPVAVSAKAAARAARKQAAREARGLDPVSAKKRVTLNRGQASAPNPAAMEAGKVAAGAAVYIDMPTDSMPDGNYDRPGDEPHVATGPSAACHATTSYQARAGQAAAGQLAAAAPAVSTHASNLQPTVASQQAPQGFPAESFDAVLLDAPCSALGLRPRLLQAAHLKYLMQCGLYSRKLMDVAVKLLKPGGRMVFSTCTISPRENEANIRYLLDKYKGVIQLIKAEPYVGGPGLVGQHPGLAAAACSTLQSSTGGSDNPAVTNTVEARQTANESHMVGSNQETANESHMAGSHQETIHDGGCMPVDASQDPVKGERWLTEEEAHLVQRFSPAGAQDTIGFFVAAFQKLQSTTMLV